MIKTVDSQPGCRINVGSVCVCKPQIRLNYNLLYVATSVVIGSDLRFRFSLLD